MQRSRLAFPFLPGDAIFHARWGQRVDDLPTYTRGTVTKATPKGCFVVQLDSGRTIRTKGTMLTFAGHCPTCERPAVVRAERRVCPHCGGPAEQVPPVLLAVSWLPPYHDTHAVAVYAIFVQGITTMRELWRTWNRRHIWAYQRLQASRALLGSVGYEENPV